MLFFFSRCCNSLTHDSGVNFDPDADVVAGLAQQQHLLTENPLLQGQVLTRYLQASLKTTQTHTVRERQGGVIGFPLTAKLRRLVLKQFRIISTNMA